MDCKNCETKLTEMKNGEGETTCLRCLNCHPLTKYVAPAKKEDRYVDIPWTDERVIEVIDRVVPDMIRETLENWHIQKPPVTKDEIEKPTVPITDELLNQVAVIQDTPNWRARAKELGISLSQPTGGARKKVDVLAEIAEKTKTSE